MRKLEGASLVVFGLFLEWVDVHRIADISNHGEQMKTQRNSCFHSIELANNFQVPELRKMVMRRISNLKGTVKGTKNKESTCVWFVNSRSTASEVLCVSLRQIFWRRES